MGRVEWIYATVRTDDASHSSCVRPSCLLFHAKTFRQFAGHPHKSCLHSKRGLITLVSESNVRHVSRRRHPAQSPSAPEAVQSRQQNIGVFCRRGHMTVDNDDHFAFLVILPRISVGAVVWLLVNQTVASMDSESFDRHVSLSFPARHHATPSFRAAFQWHRSHKHGDAGFNRIFQRGHTFKWRGIRGPSLWYRRCPALPVRIASIEMARVADFSVA